MQTHSRTPFLTIHTEGALLPVDLLQRILDGDKNLGGLAPADYHISEGEKLNEAINRSWNRLQGSWSAFQTSRGRLKPGDPGTTLTRERWLLPLFQELGYGRLTTTKAIEIEGKSYPVSHAWGSTPIHLVGCGADLERRAAGVSGASKSSPHSLVQELLNRDDSRQWGIVSNGLRLRILRDNASLTRQAFLEFDLEAMWEGEIYADFVLLWLAAHQSRFENDGQGEGCWLERWSKTAQEQGTRALDRLRSGVEEAITVLGQGFLVHPANDQLRQKLKSGALNRQQYFRQLLRLVYRMIFLFVAEDRDLLLVPQAGTAERERYAKYYSTARLRRLAERQRGGRHTDLWQELTLLTDLLAGVQPGGEGLGLPVLGGFLFSHQALPDLEDSQVDNQALLAAVRSLAFTLEKKSRRAVDYKNLGSEELGSVYESLLELQPLINIEAGTFQLASVAGNERKTTGSYYTAAGLIKITLDSALDPVILQAILRAGSEIEKQIAALLALKICDPACGSGHFLIAAARRLARRIAQLRSGDEEPSPALIRHALREVIAHCIYGVDINSMAVELCKVNLWLEALEPGKPLTFLDAHIKCGNSLVGVGPGMNVYNLVIPDEAFDPVTGDDKKTAAALKKRNKQERQGQLTFDLQPVQERSEQDYAERARQVEAMPEETPEQVAAKEATYTALQADYQTQHRRLLADMWAAAFFWHLQPDNTDAPTAPTYGEWRKARIRKPSISLADEAQRTAKELNFFHWPLEFTHVFEQGGFECVLGNPPWERIKLQEEEFFAQSDPNIAAAANKAARQKLIDGLIYSNPSLAKAFQTAKHAAECSSKFVRQSARYPLTAIGDINSYALFAEVTRKLLSPTGRLGIIVPTGIATDDSTKDYFGDLVVKKSLVSLFDFENREVIFPGVHRNYKFSILTLSQSPVERVEFVFFATQVKHLQDPQRRFVLTPADISRFNPNTRTVPIFRTSIDAGLTLKIYENSTVLVNERSSESPWGASFLRMFDMSNDSHLFADTPRQGFIQLYEAKMIEQFEHRWSTWDGKDTIETTVEQLINPNFQIRTRYWVPEAEVNNRVQSHWARKWFVAFRGITRSVDRRTSWFSVVPYCGVGNSSPVLLVKPSIDTKKVACLVACFNSFVLDFAARQKVGGINFNFFIVNQLPVLPPSAYQPIDIDFIAPRVLELTYTALDLRSFADDMDYHGQPFRWDEERRALLRAELDAYYARLYGLTRDELRYILDPQDVYGPDFPGETFRVLKDKETKQFGEYRTRRLVLEAWDRLEGVAPAVVERVEVRQPESTKQAPMKEKAKPVQVQLAKAAPKVLKDAKPEPAGQAAFTDFGLYQCEACGKMVMGFEKENHEKGEHRGKKVEWTIVKR